MKIRSGHRWKSFMTAFCTMMCVPMVEKKFSYLSLLTRAFTTSRSSKRNFFHHNASRISNLPRLLNSKQCKIILITFYYSSFTTSHTPVGSTAPSTNACWRLPKSSPIYIHPSTAHRPSNGIYMCISAGGTTEQHTSNPISFHNVGTTDDTATVVGRTLIQHTSTRGIQSHGPAEAVVVSSATTSVVSSQHTTATEATTVVRSCGVGLKWNNYLHLC